jgi:hypothetical protein
MDRAQVLYSSKKPISFLSWLELQERVSDDFSLNYKQYQDYITEWLKNTKEKNVNSDELFTSLYVDLMRELTLNFSTEEEKRFIINFDYTKKENIDIIVPFFVSKLKALCLYYSNKRENLKSKIASLHVKGTNKSVVKIVKDIILTQIMRGKTQKVVEGKTTIPSLTSVNQFLDVQIEELYDDTNYFDTDPGAVEKTEALKLGVYPIDSDLYENFTNAIIKAINQYPVFIDSLKYNISVNMPLSGTELEYLKERDFINYLKGDNSENLKINLIKQIAPKYLSSNFYYLSVGNTFSDVSSGILFNTGDYNGERIQNLSNRSTSTVAAVQSLDNLYSAYEIGKFFIPSKTGVLVYSAPDKNFFINYNKLTPNSLYVFPDPSISEGEDTEYSEYPLLYKVNLDWSKIGSEGNFCFGDVISDKAYQRFYGYESLSQDVLNQPYGLSLSVDNTDFWSGNEDTVWTEKELWPGLDKIEKLQLEQRTDSLLINKGVPIEWYSDIYGNEFSLYKNVKEDDSISDRKVKMPGKLYVKNTTSGLVSSFEHHFSSLVRKYPEKVLQELSSEIYSVYVIQNVIVVETENYVTIDSYDFDYTTKQFINTLLPGVYIPKFTINSNLEKFVNSFYVEDTEDLFLCFLKLLPSLSASNYKSLYPVIYKVNINKLNLEQLYPSSKFNTTIYSLSSTEYKNFADVDLRYIEGGKFSYSKKYNLFNLTYYAYNLNSIPFIVNEQFSYNNESNTLYSFVPLLHKPYYYINDVNFADPKLNTGLRFGASYSEIVGSKAREEFKWGVERSNQENFHFNSSISPVYINTPGTHFVQFDWEQYIYGNIFIGCENLGVTKVDNNNIIDFRDGSPVLRLQEEEIWYKVSDYYFNNIVYTLSAKRPYNTDNSIIEFCITSPVTASKDIFCDNLFTTYKTVSVVKLGNGSGNISSKPFCIDCGNVCSFLYPKNSSITLIPSAAKDSSFAGWRGSDCEGLASSCFLTVTDNTVLTAVFNTVPYYDLKIVSTLPTAKITSNDGLINYPLTTTARYKQDSFVVLSASNEVGYLFKGFLGSNCGENNPCGTTMYGNITLTAKYIESVNQLTIHNKSQNNEPGQGVIYCSLDQLNPITTSRTFTAPTNTVVTIAAVPSENFVFRGFEGSPCGGIKTDTCIFTITNNKTVSGFFSRPLVSVSVETYGSGVFYVESDDKAINYGTFNLRNERNKSTAVYTSGTYVSLSAYGTGDTGILSLCSGKVNVYSNDIDGDSMLALTFMATNNVKVSAVGLADVINFTISKSGNGSFFERNTIEGDYKLEDGVESKTFITYKSTKASFTPKNEMTDYNRILYTIGNTGISYSIEVKDNNPFYIKNLNDVEQKIIEQKIDDSFIIENVDDPIEYIGLDEGAPYYSNINDVLEIDYTGGEVYNDLYITGLSAIVVYESK